MGSKGFKNTHFFWVFIFLSGLISCKSQTQQNKNVSVIPERSESITTQEIIIAKPQDYLSLISGKTVGIVANQTSTVKNIQGGFTHLIDTLLTMNIKVKAAFAPEHGFRGQADAGEHVYDSKDERTGLPVISLHGNSRKASKEQLAGIDVMIFDIQDVGTRFYTYLSTLHYVMEACAENNIPLIVIDRPNPNANYIDGPVMEDNCKSFLGMHPVPLVYGMTIGEYAQMINGEKWLKDGVQCKLTVMPLKNYNHNSFYSIPIKPSPNLPNDKAINLYPSMGLFEGTSINAGRGTDMQFQIFGAPYLPENNYPFTYTPKPNPGAKNPKQLNKLCHGLDLRNEPKMEGINLNWLIDAYRNAPKGTEFFQGTFTAHAGTKKLQEQIKSGMTAEEIKKTWKPGIEEFKKVRGSYLIYE